MQVYFLAERECILTLGGMALGIVDGFERSVELDPADGVLCTLAPLGGYLPVSFCIDEDFLIAPPPGIALYHRNGKGCALYASGFCRTDQSLNVLQKAEVNGARLTLFRQGKLFLEIAEEDGMHLCALPDELEKSSFFAQDDGFLDRKSTRLNSSHWW